MSPFPRCRSAVRQELDEAEAGADEDADVHPKVRMSAS